MVPLLDISGASVVRGRVQLLQAIDWRVQRGEHWVILGANGSGKTSLLKVLTGYLAPTSGRIELLGRRFGEADWRELRLQIGVVTSAFAAAVPLFETALETVVSGKYAQLDLWHAGTRGDRMAARRLLRAVNLEYLAEREWVYLSQGERQRVLIARALMARPRLLILDEPCAGLDPVARERFLAFIEALARIRVGASIVLVTHHVEEITPSFTHILLLRGGQVLAAGKRDRLLTSALLSETFGAPLRLRRAHGRLQLQPARAASKPGERRG